MSDIERAYYEVTHDTPLTILREFFAKRQKASALAAALSKKYGIRSVRLSPSGKVTGVHLLDAPKDASTWKVTDGMHVPSDPHGPIASDLNEYELPGLPHLTAKLTGHSMRFALAPDVHYLHPTVTGFHVDPPDVILSVPVFRGDIRQARADMKVAFDTWWTFPAEWGNEITYEEFARRCNLHTKAMADLRKGPGGEA